MADCFNLTSDVWRLSLEIDSPQSPEVIFSPDTADSLLRHDHDGKVLFVSDKTNPEKCRKVKDILNFSYTTYYSKVS